MKIIATLIVKNEQDVIGRCLDSLKHKVDGYCITDTGSTDNTMEVIHKHLPWEGTLVLAHGDWTNDFAAARNANLSRAQSAFGDADYFLHIDADEVFQGEFDLESLTEEGYRCCVTLPEGKTFPRMLLSRPHHRFIGAIHEILDLPAMPILRGVSILSLADGARSKDPDTRMKDLRAIEDSVAKDPSPRMRLQLGVAYEQVGQWRDADFVYKGLVGPDPYGRCAAYRRAVSQELYGVDSSQALLEAANCYHPCAVAALAEQWNKQGLHRLAYAILSYIQDSEDELLAPAWWQIQDEMAVAAGGIGDHQKALDLCRNILATPGFPEAERARVSQNIKTLLEKMEEKK